ATSTNVCGRGSQCTATSSCPAGAATVSGVPSALSAAPPSTSSFTDLAPDVAYETCVVTFGFPAQSALVPTSNDVTSALPGASGPAVGFVVSLAELLPPPHDASSATPIIASDVHLIALNALTGCSSKAL